MARLLLIDGYYYVYRSFFAIRNLSNSRGEPTNAIYGFVKTVRKMLKDLTPDFAAVVWDEGLPERRTQLQPEYKQQRAEMPSDLAVQLDTIHEIVPLIGLANLSMPNTEADDLMASYAIAARAVGHEVILATNDKDLFQLTGEGVSVYSTNKTDLASPSDPHALLGEAAVLKKWGVPPSMIGDILALIGDSVDNIPGVPGVGLKTAATLLVQHGGLDRLLENPDAIANEKLRGKFRAALDLIRQNREMVRLDLDLPLPVPVEQLAIRPRYPEWIAALEKWEFKSLTTEVRAESEKSAPKAGQGEFLF
ncbi:MAG TPA: 5'-3' exonuclease H3TH domain-containing protein [Chthoniobacterales bacterium]